MTMNKRMTLMATAILSLASVVSLSAKTNGTNQSCCQNNLTQYVDMRIGTGGHGHTFYGANAPFGLVQLGPTEPTRGWDWCSGYHISDNVLIGFGHMHLSGTGIGELGDVALLPVTNEKTESYIFNHNDERCQPGYYSLVLPQDGIVTELTATQRAGMHRYTFLYGKKGMLRLNLNQGIGWDHWTSSAMEQPTKTLITGYRKSSGWAKNQQVYFAAEFSCPVTLKQLSDTIAIITPEDQTKPLIVKVGLSAVSTDNAKMNLDKEIPGWDFDAVRKATCKAWNNELGRIKIETADKAKKTIYYTAFYHTMVAPSVFSDVNGDYRGSDGEVHNGKFTNYTTLSLWDTYRALHPLMTIVHPDKMSDLVNTFLNIYKEQGRLPVWHLMGNETDCMVGNPGVIVLGDLVMKGYCQDKKLALEAMAKTMLGNDRGLKELKDYGYIPFDKDTTNETVAKGLEYAIADDAVAQVAKLVGAKKNAAYFSNRSKSYKKYFDKGQCFMRGKDSQGQWRTPFNPFKSIHRFDDFTEGNAWQYTWLVPHDVKGLVSIFPSKARFEEKLDSLFIVEGDLGADASPDISGLIGQYAHGNEPSHHTIYLYNYIGKPRKAAKLLRQTMDEMYTTAPDGLCGNEDVGQMSAWYVLSALGIYQVEPVGGKFVFGTPLFDKATIAVGNGKTFTIEAQNLSPKNIYIHKVLLNGKQLKGMFLDYKDIMKGGKLTLVMGE